MVSYRNVLWETFFLKNHKQNLVEKLFADPVLKNRNWASLWIESLKFYTHCTKNKRFWSCGGVELASCLIFSLYFVDIGQYVYCNCLLTNLRHHKFWNSPSFSNQAVFSTWLKSWEKNLSTLKTKRAFKKK